MVHNGLLTSLRRTIMISLILTIIPLIIAAIPVETTTALNSTSPILKSSIFLSDFLLPIAVTLITYFVINKISNKNNLPVFVRSYSQDGENPDEWTHNEHDTIIMGNQYKKEKELEKEFIGFLKTNGFIYAEDIKFSLANFYRGYCNNPDHAVPELPLNDPQATVQTVFECFKNIPEYIRMLKTYGIYENYSGRTIIIKNVGHSSANCFLVTGFRKGAVVVITDEVELKSGDEMTVRVTYFDKTLETVDEPVIVCPPKLQGKKVGFYIVKKHRYNFRDERIFHISYYDFRGKKHVLFGCAKLENRENMFK